MLTSYKDEVAYLKEALQIAAEKVAEVEGFAGMLDIMEQENTSKSSDVSSQARKKIVIGNDGSIIDFTRAQVIKNART